MKKVLALALAAMMVLALCGTAFAAAGDLAADTTITVTGLADGDTVYLVQVLEWVDGAGWALTDGFTSLNDATNYPNIAALVDPNTTADVSLTRAEVEAITTAAKTKNAWETTTLSGTDTFTKNNAALGMYLVLVAPVDTDTVYNPIIVSADFTPGETNEIDASHAVLVDIQKKEKVTLKKTQSEITFEPDEYVQFTVETVIPAYANSYTNPTFVMQDQLSAGLKFVVDDTHKFEITSTVSATGTPSTGDTSFTLTFDSTQIAALVAPATVKVEYWAQITSAAPYNINEMTNDVTVKFSNNPKDDTSHGHLKDETKEYTFSIDASIFGNGSYHSGEFVKVGKDKNGNDILESKELSNGTWHSALQGATFGVFESEANANAYENNPDSSLLFSTTAFNGIVESDANGLININGLKGNKTYYIKELTAPAGFVKDPNVYSFTITYTTTTESVTEKLEDNCVVTYDVERLTGYTVTTGDGTKSTYSWTNDGPRISTITPGDNSDEIVNTKGLELPSTGGIGTTIFYVAGLIMVLGASVILVSRRRADAE